MELAPMSASSYSRVVNRNRLRTPSSTATAAVATAVTSHGRTRLWACDARPVPAKPSGTSVTRSPSGFTQPSPLALLSRFPGPQRLADWSYRLVGGAEQAIGVVHRPAADQRQRGLLGGQVVNRAVQQVSAEPDDIRERAGRQDPDVAILAEQPAARRGVEPDGRVGVHRVLRALDSRRSGAAGDQSPDGQQRVEEADVAIAAGGDQRSLLDPGPDRHDLAGAVLTPVPHQVAAE